MLQVLETGFALRRVLIGVPFMSRMLGIDRFEGFRAAGVSVRTRVRFGRATSLSLFNGRME